MKTQLFIPNKIKVGFNLRNDTYTGKLGYVIYHDGKTWRKETSWEGWRQKEGQSLNQYDPNSGKYVTTKLGPEINPLEFENVPTEGFVLNKKAGGYSSGWNHRATYCRIFDPRGFEFEISIPNLLFILQETSSFKGKGLEGEFVYAWEGKDLVLLPAHCEEYKQSQNFTKLQSGKVGVKDLIPGCSYKTKKQEDLIYLGKFNWYSLGYAKGSKYYDKVVNLEKLHVFYDEKNGRNYQKGSYTDTGHYIFTSGLSNLASRNSDDPVSNYAELVEEFSKSKYSSKPIEIVEEDSSLSFRDDQELKQYGYWMEGEYCVKQADGIYNSYSILAQFDRWSSKSGYYELRKNETISFKDGELKIASNRDYNNQSKKYSREDLRAMKFKKLSLKLENGKKFSIKNF